MNTALTELQLLNAAIDSHDPYFFSKNSVDRDWFPTFSAEYDFIQRYIRDHAEMPTLATLVGESERFDFAEYESVDTLRRRLGDALAKKEMADYLAQMDTSKPYNEILADIERRGQELSLKYGIRRGTESNWRTNGMERFARYLEREQNKRKLIPSGFREINQALTGKPDWAFVYGDYIVFYGRTKKGKSHLVRKTITIPAMRAGFRVLDLALENERAEIEFMLDSIESADQGLVRVNMNGVEIDGGFDRRKLVFGYMDDAQREVYREWTGQFTASNDSYGDYIIKTFEDDDMGVVDLAKIEALIDEYEPDVLLVDPIYLCTYPRLGDRTPGAAAQAFSRGLRRLATRKQLVIAVTVQASLDEGGRRDDEEDGELEIPDIAKIKTSKSLLEDSTVAFGIDSNIDIGKAVVGVMLSRKGGTGAVSQLQYIPNFGIVRSIDEAIQRQTELVGHVKLF